MNKRLSSASWSVKLPAVVSVTPNGVTLSRIPENIYSRLVDEIFQVIGRRNGSFTAIRRAGVWQANFALPLREADLRRLSVSVGGVLARCAKKE